MRYPEKHRLVVGLATRAFARANYKLLILQQLLLGTRSAPTDSKARAEVSAAIRDEWRNSGMQAAIRWDVHLEGETGFTTEHH